MYLVCRGEECCFDSTLTLPALLLCSFPLLHPHSPPLRSSFGFNTAVGEAAKAIESVLVESMCAPNGTLRPTPSSPPPFGASLSLPAGLIPVSPSFASPCSSNPAGVGIVTLMGKHAGYIASHAVMASREVDVCLIPEIPFQLHGPDGLLDFVQRVVQRQGFAVIVIAEGAGEPIVRAYRDAAAQRKARAAAKAASAAAASSSSSSASASSSSTAAAAAVDADTGIGNTIKTLLSRKFKASGLEPNIKCQSGPCPSSRSPPRPALSPPVTSLASSLPPSFLPLLSPRADVDPGAMIRSVPASAADSIMCLSLAHNAVHACMAG